MTVEDDHVFAVGDQYETGSITFVCGDATADTGCNDNAPTRADVEAGTGGWSMALTLDTTNISTEGAVKYLADDAACTEWVAGSSWLEYQWACESGATKKYRCMVPNKCSTFEPTSTYVDGATAVWMQDETNTTTVEAWGETLTLTP